VGHKVYPFKWAGICSKYGIAAIKEFIGIDKEKQTFHTERLPTREENVYLILWRLIYLLLLYGTYLCATKMDPLIIVQAQRPLHPKRKDKKNNACFNFYQSSLIIAWRHYNTYLGRYNFAISLTYYYRFTMPKPVMGPVSYGSVLFRVQTTPTSTSFS